MKRRIMFQSFGVRMMLLDHWSLIDRSSDELLRFVVRKGGWRCQLRGSGGLTSETSGVFFELYVIFEYLVMLCFWCGSG